MRGRMKLQNVAWCLTATPRGMSETASIQQVVFPEKDLATPFPMGRGQGAVADTGVD